ncbi:hypothetical protein [Desulfurella sp.]|nr:hypothetical protein [Desulfurella sp.]
MIVKVHKHYEHLILLKFCLWKSQKDCFVVSVHDVLNSYNELLIQGIIKQ